MLDDAQEHLLGLMAWHKDAARDGREALLPAIIQHAESGEVLMLGYMNREALEQTLRERRVVFYSRSKARLWMKGEHSGHVLDLVAIRPDCDHDALLVSALPRGPTCHTGARSCFLQTDKDPPPPKIEGQELGFLLELERIIERRTREAPERSYTAKLLSEGPARIAQKVGEEGVEVALAAVTAETAKVVEESADLLFHLLVLLKTRSVALADVVAELAARHDKTRRHEG
jgi:phosphoribosyl-ATP pyrophosphohydrolase/phosphoribosyl-AMP cyclohydrolase